MSKDQRRSASGSTSRARANLVEAAVSIICREGHAAATSRAITSEAGENLASITYYFGSKRRLMGEAHAELATRLIGPVIETLTSDRPPIERLLDAVGQLRRLLEANREQVAGYSQTMAAAAHDPSTGEGLRDLHQDLREVLADDIRAQLEAGVVPGWVDAPAMANLIIALVNGVAITSAADPDGFDAGPVAGQFAALLAAARNPIR